jgi:translation initiation factor IF-1
MPNWPLNLAIVTLPVAASGTSTYHDVNATVVSADPQASTFTLRLDDGSTSRGKAIGSAARTLRLLRAGDKVRVTCKDTTDVQRVAATEISVLFA